MVGLEGPEAKLVVMIYDIQICELHSVHKNVREEGVVEEEEKMKRSSESGG